MLPKERRDRLFKSGRPFIRPIQIYDGENYGKDIGILWVAHKKNPFEWLSKDFTQEEFAQRIEEIAQGEDLLVAEDQNSKFKNGSGVVGVFSLTSNGWKFEPHFQVMPWATTKNLLRVIVAFLQYIRYSKKVGVCVVYSLESSIPLFNKCCEYGVLYRVGKIVNGDPRGDEYVYSVAGKRKVNVKDNRIANGQQQQIEFIQDGR